MSSGLHDAEHEKFRELCALASSGGLTKDELAQLKAHLERCELCRERRSQYRALETRGFPALADSYAEIESSGSWDVAASWKRMRMRLRASETPGAMSGMSSANSSNWLERMRARLFGRKRSKKSAELLK